MNTNTLISRYDAAERIGWGRSFAAARRVERRLARAERHYHVQLLLRRKKGQATMVLWDQAERYLPERTTELASIRGSQWRDFLDHLDQRIADGADHQIEKKVVPELRSLWKREETLAEALKQIKERFQR